MTIRWSLAVAVAALTAVVSVAVAQTALLDQKALVEGADVAEVLKAASTTPEISEAAARKFGPMLFDDGMLSVAERDLMLELLNNASGRVTITTATGDTFEVPPLSRLALAFLNLVRPPDLGSLWLRGPAQMKQLVDITVLDRHISPRVTEYIQQRLNLVWMESTIANGYEPMRRDLSIAIRQLQQTDADTERQGRSLIFDAARQLDRRNSDAIPNYLYDYLR